MVVKIVGPDKLEVVLTDDEVEKLHSICKNSDFAYDTTVALVFQSGISYVIEDGL